MTSSSSWDVIVVGAGPAGLLAAMRAAECGCHALLLEKNPRPGVKILMSGGTRCNVTHDTDERGIVAAYGQQGPFLHSALAALGPSDLLQLLAAEGVHTKVEEGGKVFPVSDKAADVLDALLNRFRRSGAELALGQPLRTLQRTDAGFRLQTPDQILETRHVVLTTGGQSYPGCGTTGDGYVWAAELGHTIIPPRPALTPVTTDLDWIRSLRGITIPDVLVQVLTGTEAASASTPMVGQREASSPGRKTRGRPAGSLASARGSFLFTHFGLSGPPVLDVSRVISQHPTPRALQLVCDLLPDESSERLEQWLDAQCAADGKRRLAGMLSERLPRRLVEEAFVAAGLPVDRRAAETPRRDRQLAVATLKRLTIPVSGVMGFRKAEVTAGGVSLDEVDSRSMQSKRVPGLYLAGELLDLDGPIGGYNFQAAFSTGWLAGQSLGPEQA